MGFSNCRVYVEHLDNYVVYFMGATWFVESDSIFEAMYPNFRLELVSRGTDEDTA